MDPASHYAQLEVDPGFSLFGRTLKPYSIGHVKLLSALRLEDPQTLPELAAAVAICSVRASEALQVLSSFWWTLRLNAWAFWLGVVIWWTSGPTKAGPVLITLKALERWKEYLTHYSNRPSLVAVKQDGSGTVLGAPYLSVVEYVLTNECGVLQEDIADMRLDRALWLFSVAREQSGSYQMLETGEEIGVDQMAEYQRQADELQAQLDAEALKRRASA